MSYYIGCDLGTSAIKLTVCDEKGEVILSADESYPCFFPKDGYSEQKPEDWLSALKKGLKIITSSIKGEIKGLAIDGQMHGLVPLDKDMSVLRRAILWNDSRSTKECLYLNKAIGKDTLIKETGNIAYPGFTLPKIIWMKNNEPELFARIKTVFLPKDYLNYCLTGKVCTDYSDAAGTLALNVKKQCWSKSMIDLSGLDESCFPEIVKTGSFLGYMKEDIAKECGFKKPVKIYQGAADNAASAIGNGVVNDSECNISLGTSGTIFVASNSYVFDKNGAIHSFLTGTDNYCLLACMLSAASCLKWLTEEVFKSNDFVSVQKRIKNEDLGNSNVFFLPYLMGERSPINDPKARGVFFGLSMDTKQEDLVESVMEGVAFALRDSFECFKKMGIDIKKSYITGGGSKSPLWKKIISNVLDISLETVADSSGPSYGMCLVVLLSEGVFKTFKEEKDNLIKVTDTTIPEKKLVEKYQLKYEKYQLLYPSLKNVFSIE